LVGFFRENNDIALVNSTIFVYMLTTVLINLVCVFCAIQI